MTDSNTPAHGGGHPASPTQVVDEEAPVVDETPADDETYAEPEREAAEPEAAGNEPVEPRAAETEAVEPRVAEPDTDTETAEPPVDAPQAVESEAEPQAATQEPAHRPLPPLSPPGESPSAGAAGALRDDSALRAAEAARAGQTDAPAAPVSTDQDGTDQDDLDDTRISAPGTGRSSTAAWTPPPAPASPAEHPAPAVATPTPYAPSSGETGQTEAVRPPVTATPMTSTTPIQSLGQSPAERLGFDGIAGGDDGFTPEELAQRRAFRDELAFRQKQEFAGINFGAGFFGWLAAVGLAGILYLIAGGIAVASGLAQTSVITGSTDTVKSLGSAFDTHTLQITALVVFLVVLFLSYFVGGFVASRMARFSGLKQGLAVWLWGVFMSIIVGVVGVVLASQSTTISTLSKSSSFDVGTFTSTTSLIGEALIIVLSIGGALLGGLAGQAFHRKVDRFGVEEI